MALRIGASVPVMHIPTRSCPCCRPLTRRDFISSAAMATAALALPRSFSAEPAPTPAHPPFIDIHFHHNSLGAPAPGSKDANDPTMVAIGKRSDAEVVAHQRNTGALLSVLLGANDATMDFGKRDPARWVSFAREPVDDSDGRQRTERMLKKGAIGIGEMKEKVACDSPQMISFFELAREYDVPVLMHFEDDAWC